MRCVVGDDRQNGGDFDTAVDLRLSRLGPQLCLDRELVLGQPIAESGDDLRPSGRAERLPITLRLG